MSATLNRIVEIPEKFRYNLPIMTRALPHLISISR
jgi:hypothetical protein